MENLNDREKASTGSELAATGYGTQTTKKRFYLKIKFKDFYNGRKIWYQCSEYMCDCVNKPFTSKERCKSWILRLKKLYGERIESITLHWTRFSED